MNINLGILSVAASIAVCSPAMMVGKARASSQCMSSDWRDMSSAPRDGTVVELCCSYGVAPWYGLFKWTDEIFALDQEGVRHPFKSVKSVWQRVDSNGGGNPYDEQSLSWRPTKATASTYIDPTGGAQNTIGYWQRAAGVPSTDNRRLDDPTINKSPSSLIDRVLSWFGW